MKIKFEVLDLDYYFQDNLIKNISRVLQKIRPSIDTSNPSGESWDDHPCEVQRMWWLLDRKQCLSLV